MLIAGCGRILQDRSMLLKPEGQVAEEVVSHSDEPPRVLLHVFSMFSIGGPAVRMAGLINYFGRRYRHVIISLDGTTACRSRLVADVDVSFKPAGAGKSRNPLVGVQTAWRTMRRIRPDVLLTYNWGAMDWALAHSLRPFCRHLHFEDGFGPQEADRQLHRRVLFRRLALSRTFRLVVPSVTLQRIAVEQWRIPAGRIALIPNGIADEQFVELAKERTRLAGDLLVGIVAPLRPEKNIGLLIEVFAQLACRHQVRLLVAGDGPERKSLEAHVRRLGMSERVRFLGHVDNVAEVLAQLDVYAICSLTEQLPIALLEAMAAGKAVAALDVGDVRHALSPENRRLVAARGDRAGFATALETLLLDGELRAVLGAANQRWVREHYGYQQMAKAYDNLLSA